MRDNDLPPGWAEASVQDLASPEPRPITDGPFGSNLKTAHYTPEGPRVIRLQNIGELRFVDDRAHIGQEHFESLSAHSVRPNDVLIAGLGEQLPRSCLAPSFIGSAIVKADCFRVRTHPEIVPAYLCALLNSPQVRSASSARISGVGRPRLNLQKVREIRIPVPPTKEQDRIVAAIEEQFSRLDAGLAALTRVQQDLKRMRAAILLAAVTGQLVRDDNSEPTQSGSHTDWSWQPLEAIITRLRNGVFVSRPGAQPIGQPILRISAVRSMTLDICDVRYVSTSAMPDRPEDFFLAGGDLLFTRYSGNPEFVGACAMVPMNVPRLLYPDKLIRVQVDRAAVEPRFVEIAASAGATRRTIRSRVKTTAGQTGISGSDLKSVLFPVPSLDVQRRIIQVVDHAMSDIGRLEDAVATGAQRSSSLRSSILAAAFRGKLASQDPHDEPAPVLLDRIAAGRTASNGSKPTSGRTRTRSNE